MDVTSLLNAASAVHKEAALTREGSNSMDQTLISSILDEGTSYSPFTRAESPEKTPSRRTSDSKPPSRNRTPWDANGYALPLTVDTKSTQAPAGPICYSESPVDSVSPNSEPRHKISDSQSSMSSYASSSTSLTHSRISSMSTVSGMHTMSTIPDVSSLEVRSDCAEQSVGSNKRPRREGVLSPAPILEEPATTGHGRPGSPSDAMLMSRTIQCPDRMSPPVTIIPKHLRRETGYLVPPDLAKAHKRAASAPDFAPVNSLDRTFPPLPTTHQPTPPPSYHADRRPSYAMDIKSSSPIDDTVPSLEEGVHCMYVDDCDTNSQPRKAISHIFGRNKLCTRMIPPHVWVHYCRKHYQRTRYRNAQEYAKVQCDLVRRQVRRVQSWSDQNREVGTIGVLQDWTLAMRKREQARVQDKSKNKRRRRCEDSDEEDAKDEGVDEEEDEEETIDRAILNGTAVPDWLRKMCRDGYTTAEIVEIVGELKEHMEHHGLTQIPDIEILPNISGNPADEAKPTKAASKRKTSANRESKRQMIGGQSGLPERLIPTTPGASAVRPIHHLAHRPRQTFHGIQEQRAEESYFNSESARGPHYSFSGPLPAPTPQRLGGQPMATQLESSTASGYHDSRRPSHQRSYSEAGSFIHSPEFSFHANTSSQYPSMPPSYHHDPPSYDNRYAQGDRTFAASGPPSYYEDVASSPRTYTTPQFSTWSSPAPSNLSHPSPYAGSRHARHQSTPNSAHPSIPRVSGLDYDHPPASRSPSSFAASPSYHRRQHSFAPLARNYSSYSQPSSIQESDQTKSLYGERR
ncbi:Uu.00g101840.m01.CDS01 [Anthostomella pinea]|uniref:Uu.00g101840.m01.CDS01 n=1 Tax=Anthostomella pinea TaxID=933095 RepID=A0AAI8VDA7_9PEZI|nr:Uu.00g101840.m01.CDS01 [Anthostomella pinea]